MKGKTNAGILPVEFTNSENKKIRTIMIDDKPMFVAKDVFEMLDISFFGLKSLEQIPQEWRGVGRFPTTSGNQLVKSGVQMSKFILINEAAMYKVAFRSNKPEADQFTNWVAGEVLPSLRKTGQFKIESKGALLQNGSYIENQIFFTNLGGTTIKGYYTGGKLYFHMGTILKFFGYNSGSGGKYYAEMHGINNTVLIDEGKQKVYYINQEWIEELLRKAKFPIQFERIKTMYHDLFGIARNPEGKIDYTYKFTDKEIIELFSTVNQRPFNRGRIMDALLSGKQS